MGAYIDDNPDTCDLCHSPFNNDEEGGYITTEVIACGNCYGKLRVKGVPYIYLVYEKQPLGHEIQVWSEYPYMLEGEDNEFEGDVEHITIATPPMSSENWR